MPLPTHFRDEIIHLRRGHQSLLIGRETQDGQTRFIGYVDGVRCVTSFTRASALSALLRHAVMSTIQSGQVA